MSDLKIFTNNIEPKAENQVYKMLSHPAFVNSKIRIMPDVHMGDGAVIGFTSTIEDKLIPNVVGVDIGCGMYTVKLQDKIIDFEKLDNVIREFIPSGRSFHEDMKISFEKLNYLKCRDKLYDYTRLTNSLGTLGGGNHFIEIDLDNENNYYLVIHTGSRNLGKQVAEYYQDLAIKEIRSHNQMNIELKNKIEKLRDAKKFDEIQILVKEFDKAKKLYSKIPRDLCYLSGENMEDYLHDMAICQYYAEVNRDTIASIIVEKMGFTIDYSFQTIHNYIDIESKIVRKGAISAKKDELILIPINMRDGCILGKGKGNDDWNQSAPHGAGRIMNRMNAKELLHIEDYKESMKGVFTTSVSIDTIDECPNVYKPMEEIIENIKGNVEILKIIKSVYNFKAADS